MDNKDIANVVGVRFRDKGKVYSFDANGIDSLIEGNNVIVDTESGPVMGHIVTGPRTLSCDKLPRALRKVVRSATDEDMEGHAENVKMEQEALVYCTERIRQRNLSMRLVDVESLFDRSKMVFYFTAESRIDFRELVKDLVRKYKTRIELRQIWVRSETSIYGGIGMCGREICCSSFLNNFAPVSIKMAKEQNMLLNPEKISGLCGRLMCCLAFEHDTYTQAKKNMPKCGKMVTTADGKGKVVRQNVLDRIVVVDIGEGKEIEVSVDDIHISKEEKGKKPVPAKKRE